MVSVPYYQEKDSWHLFDSLDKWVSTLNITNKRTHNALICRFTGPSDHSVLWNAMIHPFLNMTIYGAIWYQGEANSRSPDTYNCTFPAMIDDWRAKWFETTNKNTNEMFPFGFVQVCLVIYMHMYV